MGYKIDRLTYLYWSNHNPHYTQMGDDTRLDLGEDPIVQFGRLTRSKIENTLTRIIYESLTLIKHSHFLIDLINANYNIFGIDTDMSELESSGDAYKVPNAIVKRCLDELDRQVFQLIAQAQTAPRVTEQERREQEAESQRLREEEAERHAELWLEQAVLRHNQTVINQRVQHTHASLGTPDVTPPQNTPVEYPDEWLGEPENSEIANPCIICTIRTVATVIVDCGHMCLCVHCSRYLSQDSLEPKCPNCRCHYKKIVRTYSD